VTKKIKVIKDGPLMVSGDVPLNKESMVIGSENEPESWQKKESYPAKSNYALCRCGESANKPFCDGKHATVKFDGSETAKRQSYLEMSEKTIGPELELIDTECYCAIARFCHRAGDTWTLTEKSGDPEAKRIAIEEAGNCPSGRLVAWDKATQTPIEPTFEPSISITQDTKHCVSGPLWVKGGIEIESADGYQYEVRNRVTLCRCGRSTYKPFCNGAHVKSHFNDGDPLLNQAQP
jgi:CDGSH-type Zn-finger protein